MLQWTTTRNTCTDARFDDMYNIHRLNWNEVVVKCSNQTFGYSNSNYPRGSDGTDVGLAYSYANEFPHMVVVYTGMVGVGSAASLSMLHRIIYDVDGVTVLEEAWVRDSKNDDQSISTSVRFYRDVNDKWVFYYSPSIQWQGSTAGLTYPWEETTYTRNTDSQICNGMLVFPWQEATDTRVAFVGLHQLQKYAPVGLLIGTHYYPTSEQHNGKYVYVSPFGTQFGNNISVYESITQAHGLRNMPWQYCASWNGTQWEVRNTGTNVVDYTMTAADFEVSPVSDVFNATTDFDSFFGTWAGFDHHSNDITLRASEVDWEINLQGDFLTYINDADELCYVIPPENEVSGQFPPSLWGKVYPGTPHHFVVPVPDCAGLGLYYSIQTGYHLVRYGSKTAYMDPSPELAYAGATGYNFLDNPSTAYFYQPYLTEQIAEGSLSKEYEIWIFNGVSTENTRCYCTYREVDADFVDLGGTSGVITSPTLTNLGDGYNTGRFAFTIPSASMGGYMAFRLDYEYYDTMISDWVQLANEYHEVLPVVWPLGSAIHRKPPTSCPVFAITTDGGTSWIGGGVCQGGTEYVL